MQYEDTMRHHANDQNKIRNLPIVARLLIALALLSLLIGCKAEPSTTAEASISPYNHTEDYIHELYVDGQWGGIPIHMAVVGSSLAASPIRVNGTLA
ncbi:hypothetical protein QN060_07615 [Xanthomonas oryzae pv. leersiae]|uniref:Uncharacterized protein n=1 Tax=Xanthomonas oryzae pv. leersiae TaxID=3112258 RepID=A0AAJ6H013_9XANT|nr:hypothetical protein QN060_07615 [Xanthomonas oryzae pv. oryzae]